MYLYARLLNDDGKDSTYTPKSIVIREIDNIFAEWHYTPGKKIKNELHLIAVRAHLAHMRLL